ncbi:hypothetical protein TIFTF001_029272 [Ficus carica]|uniref:Uncharacterized protein n=1 Tax=Ficus carica TaxID=3494 RepID=A0AA88DRK9_FICCA|nr:hypothetical protein TIFTF001_029272 [Ficus carica]
MPAQGIATGSARGWRHSSGFRLIVVAGLSVTGNTLEARARRPRESPTTQIVPSDSERCSQPSGHRLDGEGQISPGPPPTTYSAASVDHRRRPALTALATDEHSALEERKSWLDCSNEI